MLYIPDREFKTPEVSSRLHTKHTRASLKQARTLESNFDIAKYIEWRQKRVGITIDSLTSPDLDDWIHAEKLWNDGYIVYVDIASPTEIIERNSPIENEAFNRATSVYFWDAHIYHMLPNPISTDLASLSEGQKRLTLTLEIELNSDFEVMRKDLYQSVFTSRKRHDPESFTRWINNTADSEHEYFSILHEIAEGLRRNREHPGRISRFDDSDRRITMGEIIQWHRNSHLSSFVIQEFMVLANIVASEISEENGVNGIYRNHMSEYKDGREVPRILERAEYSPKADFHTWLWLPKYGHFTSPIRRLADYIWHIQLIAMMNGEKQEFTSQEVTQLCQYINFQIIALTWHQKNELLDIKGKRLMRRSKKHGDMKPVIAHIRHRQESGLKIPDTIRQTIIAKLQDTTQPIDDWIIPRFLENWEPEIKEELVKRLKAETRVYKYLRIFQSQWTVKFEEEETKSEDETRLTFKITISINGKIVETIEETWEKIKGAKKFMARARWLVVLNKSFESMRRHDTHSLQSRLKSAARLKARDYFLDYILSENTNPLKKSQYA